MIDSLDGTGRQFEVIWLRRLPADAVAATIHNLMVGNEDENQNNRRPYYYYYGSRQEEKKPNEGFRVDADIENNRLLLWANDSELKEVNSFLVKLGEIPGESSNPNTVRVHEPRGAEATARLLEQLQRAWRAVGPNELRIEGSALEPGDGAQPKKEAAEANDDEPGGDDKPPVESNRGITAPRRHLRPTTPVSIASTAGLAHLSLAAVPDDAAGVDTPEGHAAPKAETAAAEPGSEPPPITITITPDGRIILSSRDTKALDRLESLFAQIAPAPKNYRVFYLQNASASLVTLNLEEYFEEEDSNSQDGFMRYFYGFSYNNNSDKKGSASLAQRRKIRFIWDPDTNSILVTNATPEQLETVASLIEVYDKAPAEDTISARRFKIFKLAYAPADSVAKTIKEVYRDLLSSKDKEFNNGKPGEEKQATSTTTTYYRVYGSEDTDDKKPAKIKASFAGALSVGVDSVSNTVIISAQEEWMSSIAEMISFLDTAASPSRMTVGVHKFNTSINGQALHEALARVLGDEAASKIEVSQAAAKPGEEAEGEQANSEGNNKGTPTATTE
jgi:hypothetical protein